MMPSGDKDVAGLSNWKMSGAGWSVWVGDVEEQEEENSDSLSKGVEEEGVPRGGSDSPTEMKGDSA